MSLINDALKKAGQTPAPTSPASTKEPLRVATHQRPPRWPMFVVPPLVAVVFAAGTILVMRGWQTSPRAAAKEVPATETSQATDSAAPLAFKSVPANPAAAAPAKAGTPGAAAPTAVVTNAPAVATFPTLKLQGLIWNPQRPSVVINGKSLFVGEKIERAQVTAIDQESVTVIWNGERRVLTLP